MAIGGLENDPMRVALANELHARPFPELKAPCRAAFLAIKEAEHAAERDRARDRAHLIALLDLHGAPHPAPEANHYSGRLGNAFLKWEQHTEFVSYTLFSDGVADVPFSGSVQEMFPPNWLAAAPGKVLTSCLVRVELVGSDADIAQIVTRKFPEWFVPESLAVSSVIDGAATIAGDFRIDPAGHVRFAVLCAEETGPRRLGRIVQRLLEIETYKAAAMLTLPVAREVSRKATALDRELSAIVTKMAEAEEPPETSLDDLLRISSEIELLSSSTAFRFGAAQAYSAIVNQRIKVLREERSSTRQLFSEFMMRRFDPAMRTCRSSENRLSDLSLRAGRAANLLRTRVDVASNAQNVEVLRRMDERAALQLRLQETVEGLSVVAISYYGVNLAANLLKPLVYGYDRGVLWLYAGLTPVVVLAVALMIRRIRNRIARDGGHG